MDAERQLDSCGGCHSRRYQVGDELLHGKPLLDYYMPARLSPQLYHPDGQIQAEVFVYGSYAQSKMYQQGVKCTDCHNPHTGELKANGNAVCTQCHQLEGNPRFPTLVKEDYESMKHHKHLANSPGAECVNCHMPAQNFMVVDRRHDHGIRVPRPDLSTKLGSPNACNQCHIDKPTKWARESIVESNSYN